MLTQFIEKIESMAKPVIVKSGGREYSTANLTGIKLPEPNPIKVNTLTGLVDYLKEDRDALDQASLMIHVFSPDSVSLISDLQGEFEQRSEYLKVANNRAGFPFGEWYSVERFIIALQGYFVRTGEIDTILQFVSGLKEDASRTLIDDGISQGVTVKTGISRVANAEVPNPVTLQPYRTFLEVEQPASKFVFRLRKGRNEEGLPECSLHEADGGKWELDAIIAIRDYLKEALPEIAVIA